MNNNYRNKLIKWMVVVAVASLPFVLCVAFPQFNFFFPISASLGIGLVMGREAYIFLFLHERRYSLSWIIFHEKSKDIFVSTIAFVSMLVIAIVNHNLMQRNNLDRFIIGGLLNIAIPVCIIILGGSKDLRAKIFMR